MPATRLLLIVLILLNLLALAAGRGWLGSSEPRGEPERLTNQINPERIVLRPDDAVTLQERATVPGIAPRTEAPTVSAARAPTPAAQEDACIAYVVDTPAADMIEQHVGAASVRFAVNRYIVEESGNWWVHIPPAASLQIADETMRKLRDQGITDLFVLRDAGRNQFAISLGLFRTEARARQHLADLVAKGVTGADIAPRDPATERVEITGSRSGLDTLSEALERALVDLETVGCRT